MTYEEEKAAADLLLLVNSMIENLETVRADSKRNYDHLRKVRNILISKNINGFKNIKHYLFMDFRMIRDEYLDEGKMGEMMNDAYLIAMHNRIFNS